MAFPHAALGSLMGAVLVAGLGVAITAVADEASDQAGPKPLVVKIHADWCGTCTRLEPTWQALRERYAGQANLVVLDVTDCGSVAEAGEHADRLGIRRFFDAYKSKTGVVAVIDGSSGEPVSVLKGETDARRYEAPIAEALQRS